MTRTPDPPPLTLTQVLNRLPVRDQLAARFLGNMMTGGTAHKDPDVAAVQAYRYADSFLAIARKSWPGSQAETDDAPQAKAA